ncbi:acyl-ACP--UDP-N-acetylglucosamine O-acyltransferase [Hugenholtzia roseola]|uniref:acyl-ACP--UDP-N-acetylglucosamine O-acyltransferase n=1 Tax=Hugenholtzia roseola TaxID=1002 RepID=UPI000427FFE2|nr:acyl-ACP--UDP-N-acetylglucosamine O-acyltransferase [Hugenholtzia roseola]
MIHSLTQIHPDAKIAANVTIEAFTTIYQDVEIGEGTWIGSNVTIMDGARIGKNCKIYPGAVISAPPQDLKYKGEKTYVVIGDNSTIRECVTLNRGTAANIETKIGQNTLIMAYVHLAHDCIVGDNCILVNGVQLGGHVEIEDFAIIGGTSAIHQFTRVGAHAMVAGGSLVRRDVPPFVLAGREPLRYVGINLIGLRRRNFSRESIAQMQDIYRLIFQKGKNTSNALSEVEKTISDSAEKSQILTFIKKSRRGVIKGANLTDEEEEFTL